MKDIYNQEIRTRSYKEYKERMFSEGELFRLSKEILANEQDLLQFVENLISDLAKTKPYNKYFDWNIGSTIQHFDARIVIEAFSKVDSPFLVDSIGLTWVFGELKLKDPAIIDYLYKVIVSGRDSEAWWRAAFSLEKLGQENAIVLLKRALKAEGLADLGHYLQHIDDKKSIIGILLRSTNENLKTTIFPSIRKMFLQTSDKLLLINCLWLLGRLKLLDKEILAKITDIILNKEDYEVVYYTFFAIQEMASPSLMPLFKKFLNSPDALLRKMSVRGISYINSTENQILLEEAFQKETNPSVVSEICQGLYGLKNATYKEEIFLRQQYSEIENGLIIDDSDKWYADPSIYDVFSLAEDPENICLKLIQKEVSNRFNSIKNPIDLATGTGRMLRYLLNTIEYSGEFFAVDKSSEMLEYLEKTLNRNHAYATNIQLVHSSLVDLALPIQSDLIVSGFGFPSKFTDKELCIRELQTVEKLLSDDGVFVTLGWDETFNDELNYYWFKHIPDDIGEFDFEIWRTRRMSEFHSPRNCYLTWYKTGINVPLQFHNLKESVSTMGYLFGRDAADSIIQSKTINWNMSLGITLNTKKEIQNIIKKAQA